MTSTKRTARIAGLLYLLMSVPAIFALIYVPSKLFVHGDVAATAHNIAAAETLYRAGIVADLISQAAFILVALVLYRLLKAVDKTLAVLMVIWLVVQIPIVYASEIYRLAVLTLLDPSGPAAALSEAQRNLQIALSLDSYGNGMSVDEVFMGLWLFPLASLIYRSGFLPRLLGVLLVVAGCAYLVEGLTWLLAPAYGHAVGRYTEALRSLELITPLWLLIVGAKDRPIPD